MRLAALLATAAATLLPLTADARQAQTAAATDPAPSWAEYRRIAETAVSARLLDPESARFRWITGIMRGQLKPLLSARVTGYWACGAVNAKNSLGGYTGFETFLIAIDDGRVLSLNKDGRPGGLFTDACNKLIREGSLPAVPAEASVSADTGAAASRTPPETEVAASAAPLANAAGFAVRAMPEGAYVAAVTPGSPAQLSGLTPGMVITGVNAIPLAGMGEAMRKVVDAAGSTATLTLVGGRTIRLGGSK